MLLRGSRAGATAFCDAVYIGFHTSEQSLHKLVDCLWLSSNNACQDGWQRQGLRCRRSHQAHVLRHACREQGGLGSGHEPPGVRLLPAHHCRARADPYHLCSGEVRLLLSVLMPWCLLLPDCFMLDWCSVLRCDLVVRRRKAKPVTFKIGWKMFVHALYG